MTNPTSSPTWGDFLSIACQLRFLDRETCQRLEAEVRTGNLAANTIALQQGLIDAVQADIVETLLHGQDVVPGYEILEWIGRGGMGVVFRARQKSLDRVVAIKTIPVTQMHDPTALARFEQEAMAVARLRHPNIVAAYDFGRHAGRLYFVMELIEGLDVERQVELNGPFQEVVAWRLVRQAAAGLSHAASAKIIHRDIKPANLLLVDPPAGFELPEGLKMVKITDFGLAFLARDVEMQTRLTSLNTAIGSPHYLAPEQLAGESFDHRVDIYSLGATAFQLIAGEPPFYGMKLPQLVAQKLVADAIDIRGQFPHLSPASGELIREMTRRKPEDRIGSYPDLIQRIDAVIAAIPKTSGTQPKWSAGAATQIISIDPTPAALATQAVRAQAAASTLARDLPAPAPASVVEPGTPISSVESSRPRRLRGPRPVLALLIGVVVVAVCATAGIWRFWPSSAHSDKRSRPLVPVGVGKNLFDGLSLTGWQTHMGAWTVKRNTEGGRVLSGTSGSSAHVLQNTIGKSRRPMAHYRLSVVVQLHGAKAAEIEFGRDTSLEDEPRYVARLSKNGVEIGRRQRDLGPFVSQSELVRLERGPEEPYTLSVERQADSWRVLLDEKPIGSLPVLPEPTIPTFNLVAEDGEVWFSDIVLQGLGVPEPEPTQ